MKITGVINRAGWKREVINGVEAKAYDGTAKGGGSLDRFDTPLSG
jgi:hypothetical protein